MAYFRRILLLLLLLLCMILIRVQEKPSFLLAVMCIVVTGRQWEEMPADAERKSTMPRTWGTTKGMQCRCLGCLVLALLCQVNLWSHVK